MRPERRRATSVTCAGSRPKPCSTKPAQPDAAAGLKCGMEVVKGGSRQEIAYMTERYLEDFEAGQTFRVGAHPH